MPTRSKALHAFRIKLRRNGRTRFYVHVYIYSTLAELRQEARRERGHNHTKGLIAFCRKFIPIARAGKAPGKLMAELYFAKNHMGVGTITHEVTHAAFWWAYRNGWRAMQTSYTTSNMTHPSAADTREEQMATMIGELTRQITLELYTRKVIA